MISNIPYTAPAAPSPHPGLLYASGVDIVTWAMYALCAVAAIWLMPTGFRQSLASLWAPVGRFLAALRAPLACGWWGWLVLGLVEALRACAIIARDWSEGAEQLVRLAYQGFDRPVLT